MLPCCGFFLVLIICYVNLATAVYKLKYAFVCYRNLANYGLFYKSWLHFSGNEMLQSPNASSN